MQVVQVNANLEYNTPGRQLQFTYYNNFLRVVIPYHQVGGGNASNIFVEQGQTNTQMILHYQQHGQGTILLFKIK